MTVFMVFNTDRGRELGSDLEMNTKIFITCNNVSSNQRISQNVTDRMSNAASYAQSSYGPLNQSVSTTCGELTVNKTDI